MRLVVEVLRLDLLEQRLQLRVGDDAGQRVALEALARREHLRRDGRRRARGAAGRGAQLHGRAEVVVRPAPRLVLLERRRLRVEERRDGPRAGGAVLRARRLELRAVDDVRPARCGAAPRTPPGSSAGSMPGGSETTLHVEALRDRELHPAQRRRLAGGVAVEREPEALASAAPSSRSCCSVSAVPIDATTGSKPACRSAITSVFPSTTHARSPRAIAARDLSSP